MTVSCRSKWQCEHQILGISMLNDLILSFNQKLVQIRCYVLSQGVWSILEISFFQIVGNKHPTNTTQYPRAVKTSNALLHFWNQDDSVNIMMTRLQARWWSWFPGGIRDHLLLQNTTQVWHSEDRASWYILIIKANKMHYFSTLFW